MWVSGVVEVVMTPYYGRDFFARHAVLFEDVWDIFLEGDIHGPDEGGHTGGVNFLVVGADGEVVEYLLS